MREESCISARAGVGTVPTGVVCVMHHPLCTQQLELAAVVFSRFYGLVKQQLARIAPVIKSADCLRIASAPVLYSCADFNAKKTPTTEEELLLH